MPTVLITGASRGIGAAAAEVFAREGYNIVLNYHRSAEQALSLADRLQDRGVQVLPVCADVADAAQAKRLAEVALERFGFVDVFISNAGESRQKLLQDVSDEEWRHTMALHVDAPFYISRCLLPYMIRQRRGKILLVSSIWGMVGASCEVPYSTAKAALLGFTKALAKEVGPSNIQVNGIAPGVIETAMNAYHGAETLAALADETPLGRLGTPLEVAELLAFLASDKADFITGQVISPNGGFVIV